MPIIATGNQIKKKKAEYMKKYSKTSKGIEVKRNWRLNNPRSSTHYSMDLQDAMNNVRIRDNNTCQWHKYEITNKEFEIHVHHIFPRNEYPKLELVEQYMICYYANHHGLWHRYRGDSYSEMILSQNTLGETILTDDRKLNYRSG